MEMNPNLAVESPIPPSHESQILKRWLLWQPAMIMESRKHLDPYTQLALYKMTHRSRVIHLLGAGIAWRVILRNQLDNPLHTYVEFEILLNAALKRSAQNANHPRFNRSIKVTRNFN